MYDSSMFESNVESYSYKTVGFTIIGTYRFESNVESYSYKTFPSAFKIPFMFESNVESYSYKIKWIWIVMKL